MTMSAELDETAGLKTAPATSGAPDSRRPHTSAGRS
jgi:hypothetical protein